MSGQLTKVLVAEDDMGTRMLTVMELVKAGFDKKQIETAANGKEAFNKANEKYYDAIIMDIEMPGDNGDIVTKKIREENGPNKKTVIIAHTTGITEHTSAGEIKKKYLDLGFTDAILKAPTQPISVLIKTLEKQGISPTEIQKKVLLLAGNTDLRKLAFEALKRIGLNDYQIVEASDGFEAYYKAKEKEFGVIVVDPNSLKCKATKFKEKIQKEKGNIPIIAYLEDTAKIKELKEIGFTEVIPVNPEILAETVKKYL